MSRVLIVDDDREQIRSLARLFAQARTDLTIVTAGSGQEARRLVAEKPFELILTDLGLPDADDSELLKWIHEHCPNAAVFTMSAPTNGSHAVSNGCEHFEKPLDEQALISRVGEALSQAVHGQVHNVSLASLLQLLEMERKSCLLAVSCGERTGTLVVRRGVLVAAQAGDTVGEMAAIAIIAWGYPSITISRLTDEVEQSNIQSPLGFIVMEAMRVQDEAARQRAAQGSAWPTQLRTWRPTGGPHDGGLTFESERPTGSGLGLPRGASALALVETATGNVLRATARDDCPVGELARLASQLLLQEAETLRLCGESEGVEELVLSTNARCDVIRPLGQSQFALLVFAPHETNLVIARLELEHFIALHHHGKAPDL